mmetsp:Transcript_25050/g.33592  ORF Transcript_25050/g.33592 Transcript_25050/m.33592 type:complete len:138 (-) Transcript_25050:809-1222(-)
MIVAMISFSFPLTLLMQCIFTRYTHRNFSLRSTSIIDLAIFALVVFWFERYEDYVLKDNDGFLLTEPHKTSHIFMQQFINDVRSGDFHFDWLLSAVAFLFWIRLISMLQLTPNFGPLILATKAMMIDLINFFVLLGI